MMPSPVSDLYRMYSRRAVLRGSVLGTAGLASAALLGCGGDSQPAGGGQPSTAGTSEGVPKNIKRAQGVNPAEFGAEVPINTKKVVKGGTYRLGVTSTFTIGMDDPQLVVGGNRTQGIMDRLVYANGFTGSLALDMATSYERIDKAGLEMVVKIRPGIKTHKKAPVNGRILTAKDVAYSLMRQAGKPSIVAPQEAARYLRAQQFVGLEKAEAVDDVTVKVTFSKPNGSFMNVLADPRAQMIPIEMDTIGWRDPLKFVGTGAWMQTEFIQGQRDSFAANPDYYRSWDEGGRPGFDAYEHIVIADRSSTIAAFLSNQISRFDGIRPEEEEQLKSRVQGMQRYESMGYTCGQLIANVTLPQFKDPRVMKAIQLVLDYKGISDAIGRWTYAAITHPNYPEAWRPDEIAKLPGYNPATKAQDIADGTKLMEAAGYKEGAGMGWIFHGASNDDQLRMIDQFKKIWPKIDVKPGAGGDAVTLQNKLASGDFHVNLFSPTNGTDIATDLRTYYHTDAINGGRNNTKVSLPWIDEGLDKLMLAQTLQERTQIVRPFLQRWQNEGPAHIFYRGNHLRFALPPNVGGMDMVMGPFAYGSAYLVAPRWFWQTE